MMTGQNIICFAKDFDEVPTSNNHVMLELAKHNRVLWLNSISTRRPSLSSGRDLGKIVRKLRTLKQPLRQAGDNLWIHTPLVLPLPHSRWAEAVNRRLLRTMLALLRRQLGMSEFQLWTFLPNTAGYVGRLGESVSVYYCVDEWSAFANLDAQKTAAAEQELCRRVDVIFASARSLVDGRRPLNAETHLAPHGVDHALFAQALDPMTEVPADIAALPQPVLGFYGTIRESVDQALIAHLAERHPEWSIALVGDVRGDFSRIAGLPNVHLLGRKPHGQLPACCKGFDVGIIPYVVDPQVKHASPVKLREYLSAGLPTVSTPLPEVLHMAQHCSVAHTFEAFEQAVVEALATDSAEKRRQRSELMRNETWAIRIQDLGEHVLRVKAQRWQHNAPFVPA